MLCFRRFYSVLNCILSKNIILTIMSGDFTVDLSTSARELLGVCIINVFAKTAVQ